MKLHIPKFMIAGDNIVSFDSITISPLSPSFQYGINVFEGIRVYVDSQGRQKPFLLGSHIKRLLTSKKLIGLDLDINEALMSDMAHRLIMQEGLGVDSYMRLLFSKITPGSWRDRDGYMFMGYIHPLSSSLSSTNNVMLKTTHIRKPNTFTMPPQIKAGANYLTSRYSVLAMDDAKDSDIRCHPLLLNHNGFLSESSGSAILLFSGKDVIFPGASSDVLKSITSSFLTEQILPSLGFRCIENNSITLYDAYSADFAMMAGTHIELAAVVGLDHINYNVDWDVVKSIKLEFEKVARNHDF